MLGSMVLVPADTGLREALRAGWKSGHCGALASVATMSLCWLSTVRYPDVHGLACWPALQHGLDINRDNSELWELHASSTKCRDGTCQWWCSKTSESPPSAAKVASNFVMRVTTQDTAVQDRTSRKMNNRQNKAEQAVSKLEGFLRFSHLGSPQLHSTTTSGTCSTSTKSAASAGCP